MNLETKITIYKFTPQVFTLTHNILKAKKEKHFTSIRIIPTKNLLTPRKQAKQRKEKQAKQGKADK